MLGNTFPARIPSNPRARGMPPGVLRCESRENRQTDRMKRKVGAVLALRSERVLLDPVKREDLARFAEWFADPGLLSLLFPGAVVPVSPEDEEQWYGNVRAGQQSGRAYTFAIRAREGGRLLGSVSLFEVDGKNRSAMFGIAIADPEARGQGYGGEATELILRYGFDELNLHRIFLLAFAFNGRGIAMYRRVGFRVEGVHRDALFRDGRYHDTVVMAILEDEFRSRAYPKVPFIPADVRPWIPDGEPRDSRP